MTLSMQSDRHTNFIAFKEVSGNIVMKSYVAEAAVYSAEYSFLPALQALRSAPCSSIPHG